MKFFRRAVEMEMSINLKAMRLAYVFENAALLVWAVISQIKGYTPIIQTTIILIQNIIFFGSLYCTPLSRHEFKKAKLCSFLHVLTRDNKLSPVFEVGLRRALAANA